MKATLTTAETIALADCHQPDASAGPNSALRDVAGDILSFDALYALVSAHESRS